jgi:hypothetical protein
LFSPLETFFFLFSPPPTILLFYSTALITICMTMGASDFSFVCEHAMLQLLTYWKRFNIDKTCTVHTIRHAKKRRYGCGEKWEVWTLSIERKAWKLQHLPLHRMRVRIEIFRKEIFTCSTVKFNSILFSIEKFSCKFLPFIA